MEFATHGLRRLPMCEATARPACSSSDALLFWPFQEVDAQDEHGVWFKAFVIAASGSGRRLKYKVHFSGWEIVCDKIVAPVGLRLRTEDAEEGPRGAESEAQVRQLYPHFNIFTAPDLRPLLKESCRRQQPVASSTCHTAPSSEQPRHPPADDPPPSRGAAAHAPTARKQRRKKSADQTIYKALEEATDEQLQAVQFMRQQAPKVLQKFSDRRLLRAVQHVMRTWNARGKEAICDHAIDVLTDPKFCSSDDDGCESVAEGSSRRTAICVNSSSDEGDGDGSSAAPSAVVVPHHDCDAAGSTLNPALLRLRQRLDNAPRGGTDANFVAASSALPSSAPGLPTAPAGAAVAVTTAAVLDVSSTMLPPVSSAAKCAPPTTAASLVDAPAAALQPSRGRGRPKQSRPNSTPSKAASACFSTPATPLSPEAGEGNAGLSGEAAQEDGSNHGDGHASECMFCSDGGHLLLCEFAGCRRVAHFECAGLSEQPAEEQPWFCSEHAASSSSKQAQACGRRLQSHVLCPNCCCQSASCKCPCTECGSAQGSRAYCRTCNRCFHQ